jgi:hypothetical protein
MQFLHIIMNEFTVNPDLRHRWRDFFIQYLNNPTLPFCIRFARDMANRMPPDQDGTERIEVVLRKIGYLMQT